MDNVKFNAIVVSFWVFIPLEESIPLKYSCSLSWLDLVSKLLGKEYKVAILLVLWSSSASLYCLSKSVFETLILLSIFLQYSSGTSSPILFKASFAFL